MLQSFPSSLRPNFARLLAQKFGRGRVLVVGNESRAVEQCGTEAGLAVTVYGSIDQLEKRQAENGNNSRFDRAVWIYQSTLTAEQRDQGSDLLAQQSDELIIVPGAGAEFFKTRPTLVQRFSRHGFAPDYDCDLEELGAGAIRLMRQQTEPPGQFVSAAESALLRLHLQTRNLERTLRTRVSELEAADRHIAKLEEKILELKRATREVKQLRKEKQILRKCPERKVGQVVLAPYRWSQKLARALGNRARPTGEPTARSAAMKYQAWFERHRAKNEEISGMRGEARTFAMQPLISVLTPVFNTQLPWLHEAVQSVLAQAYENWELLLIDDGSSDPALSEYLGKVGTRDPRISTARLESNRGISAASNHGIAEARGEWLAFLDHDDLLEPDALFQIVKLLQQFPDADLIYSDEDKLTENGFDAPLFKPDWSSDFFLSCNYLSHFIAVRRDLVLRVGGFRSQFDGAQDYDLLLRVIEQTKRIHHLPRVLYHWRTSANSSASSVRQKPGQLEATRRAAEEHVQRIGVKGHVTIDWRTHAHYVKRDLIETKKISIIIPACDESGELLRCIESITSKTNYPNYELVVVNHATESEKMRACLDRSSCRLLTSNREFDWPALCNFAVEQTDSPWLLFLHSDVQAIDVDWLSTMTEHIQRAEVGAVGARLLYPDNTVEHAGFVLSVHGIATRAFHGFPAEDRGVFKQLQVTRNCSGVSGACLLTRRDVFREVGGFDEHHLLRTFSDVDFCLKIRQAGYLIVYTPFAKLYHHATKRAVSPDTQSEELMRQRWQHVLERDPYYNPNLSRKRADFSLGDEAQ